MARTAEQEKRKREGGGDFRASVVCTTCTARTIDLKPYGDRPRVRSADNPLPLSYFLKNNLSSGLLATGLFLCCCSSSRFFKIPKQSVGFERFSVFLNIGLASDYSTIYIYSIKFVAPKKEYPAHRQRHFLWPLFCSPCFRYQIKWPVFPLYIIERSMMGATKKHIIMCI